MTDRRIRAAHSAAVLLALVLAPTVARAHPYALSHFDAWAGENDVRVELQLDVGSVLGALNRAHPDRPINGLSAIAAPEERRILLDYARARLALRNDGQPCTVDRHTEPVVHEGIAKVLFELHFQCPSALADLVIESTIFNDELPPPQLLCAFHYKRAREHYFFTAGVKTAQIAVRQLAQVLPAEIDPRRGLDPTDPPPGTYADSVPVRPVSARPRSNVGLGSHLWQGVLHILGGLDHVLFVVTLVMAVRGRRQLVLIVTSFTVAHSLTLVLGTFDLLVASPRLVEPLIALSIVYVAVENILRRGSPPARPGITFGFGLVHGLGFSSALRELGLPPRELVLPLIGFNLGVEVGQLAIVLPLLPLVTLLRARTQLWPRLAMAVSAVIALTASVWFVQRLVT